MRSTSRKDAKVRTDDYRLEQLEQSQLERTHRRREDRRRRTRWYYIAAAVLIGLVPLMSPTLFCNSPFASRMLQHALQEYGFAAEVESIRIGWLSPLRLQNLQLISSDAGTTVAVTELDAELTCLDLLTGIPTNFGVISVRGVALKANLKQGRCSIEDDIERLLAQPSSGVEYTGTVNFQDIAVELIEQDTSEVWNFEQFAAKIEIEPKSWHGSVAGVVTDPDGATGSVEAVVNAPAQPSTELTTTPAELTTTPAELTTTPAGTWDVQVQAKTIPLAVLDPIRARFQDMHAVVPNRLRGDASGEIRVTQQTDGTLQTILESVEIRNLVAFDAGNRERVWRNQLATIDGELHISTQRIIGHSLNFSTDFAAATLDGSLVKSFSWIGAADNVVAWLDALEGTATASLDLALFDAALPGLIPLRQGAQLISGRVDARLEATPNAQSRRNRLLIRSDAIQARANGRAVMIEPVKLSASITNVGGQVSAEEFAWTSSFANAVGQGDLRAGAADLDVDFGRLSAMLSPILDVSHAGLEGLVRGQINWSVSPDQRWSLTGQGTATELRVGLAGGHSLHRASLRGNLAAEGRWGRDSLDELTKAVIDLSGQSVNLRVQLREPVVRPSADSLFPVQLAANGRIEELVTSLRPWLPTDLPDAGGGFSVQASGHLLESVAVLESVDGALTQPWLVFGQRQFDQPELKFDFAGQYRWETAQIAIDSLTLAGDAFSAAVQGEAGADDINVQLAWRAKMERLQGSVKPGVAAQPGVQAMPVGYRYEPAATTNQWNVFGDCDGTVRVVGDQNQLTLSVVANGTDIQLLQPADALTSQLVGPRRPAPSNVAVANESSRLNQSVQPSRLVWSEPSVQVEGTFQCQPQLGTASTEDLKVAGTWFAATLDGQGSWQAAGQQVSLRGPTRFRMDQVAQRLTQLTGIEIAATGIHQTDLELQAQQQPNAGLTFAIAGNLGWETADVAGIRLGPTTAPVRMNESMVVVTPTVIPVGPGNDGKLRLGGEVHYRPGPLWIRMQPGQVAESVRLTPEMTNRWLKFVAPLAADTTQIDGELGATIDEAIVVIGQPARNRVRGRLEIDGLQMRSGPLADRIIVGIRQLKSFSDLSGYAAAPQAAEMLVQIPAQSVEFSLANGVVNHRRLKLQVDRAEVVTSGNVSLDGQLQLYAQVPLDSKWLGQDLQHLAGEAVTLPITGTLAKPQLDASGVRDVVGQLSVRAAQGAAEGYLQQQLDRSQDQLNKSIEKGFERLGIDKIFGR